MVCRQWRIPGDSPTTAKLILRCLPVLAIALLVAARPAHAVTRASILVDAQSGNVLESWNADAQAHPASLTKLMTLYLTFQRLARGQISLDSPFYVSRLAADQEPSKMGLRPGTSVSVRDCILGITGHSANDAALVLAENIGGSEDAFVDLMNQEARHLGMTRTIFYNANGLPDNRQWTTARDMATLAIALIHTFPQYYHFFDTPSFRYDGRTFLGFDHLLDVYPGVDGMKTGYIYSSGFNIVTSAVRDDRRLVGVVLGGRTARARDLAMIALLDRGFATPFGAPTPLVASAVAPAPRREARPVVVAERTRRVPAVERIRPAAYHPDIAWTHNWTIEVGDRFHSPYSVYRVLRSARRTAPAPLRRGRAEVIRVRGWDYLARFSDLSYPMAQRACSVLRDRRFACRVLQHTDAHRSEIVDAAAAVLPAGE
jgi:D-alanyl-D-alanine carboxypeptidase